MKGKLRNYGLWISMISAVIMLLQALGLKFDVPYVNEVLTSILGVFVALGIISNPSDGNGYTDNGSIEEVPENNNTANEEKQD